MSSLPFSTKLQITLIAPVVLAALIGLPAYWVSTGSLLEASAIAHIADAMPLMIELVEPALALPERETNNRVRELSANTSLRTTLIESSGRVIADSERTWKQVGEMDNHAARPEVIDALAKPLTSSEMASSVRLSKTLGVRYVYVARRLHATSDSVLVRLSVPLTEVAVLKSGLAKTAVASVVVILLASLLVAWWLSRQLFSPLAELLSGANRLAAGEAGHRVKVPVGLELEPLAEALNHLACRTEEQLDDLRAQRAYLESIVNSVPDGILVTDQAGKSRLLNPGFRSLFDVKGPTFDKTLLELTRQPSIDSLLQKALTDSEVQFSTLETGEQPPRTLALSASALKDTSGVVLVAKDISDSVRFDTMRRDFVANVSHELRSPLAAIRGYAETLDDGALDEPEVGPRFVRSILRQCKRLQALLDDLLTLSRLESPRFELTQDTVELAAVAHDAVELLAAMAHDRGIEVQTDLADAPPIRGDRRVLERLMINLIENAIKYNREGGTVHVATGAEASEAFIAVADTGIGIPQESIDRIFERFFRVDKGRSREEGGTGLGLAIVKHAAHMHSGRVKVTSVLNSGTEFRIYLPAAHERPLDAPQNDGVASL